MSMNMVNSISKFVLFRVFLVNSGHLIGRKAAPAQKINVDGITSLYQDIKQDSNNRDKRFILDTLHGFNFSNIHINLTVLGMTLKQQVETAIAVGLPGKLM